MRIFAWWAHAFLIPIAIFRDFPRFSVVYRSTISSVAYICPYLLPFGTPRYAKLPHFQRAKDLSFMAKVWRLDFSRVCDVCHPQVVYFFEILCDWSILNGVQINMCFLLTYFMCRLKGWCMEDVASFLYENSMNSWIDRWF